MKVDWPVECLPIKIGFWFSWDRWKFFLDGYGHWMRWNKTVIRVNQLSETKVYAHWYVNNSITALFTIIGNYAGNRKVYKKLS